MSAAKESGGFGTAATRTIDAVLTAVGVLANGMRGIVVIAKTIVLGFETFGLAGAAVLSGLKKILYRFWQHHSPGGLGTVRACD